MSKSNNQCFGVDMAVYMQHKVNKDMLMPIIIENCLTYIESTDFTVEGIFRISGNQKQITAIRSRFDKGQCVDFSKETNCDIHVVCGLLKLYLRELPDPLIPFSFFDPIIETLGKTTHHFELIHRKPKQN